MRQPRSDASGKRRTDGRQNHADSRPTKNELSIEAEVVAPVVERDSGLVSSVKKLDDISGRTVGENLPMRLQALLRAGSYKEILTSALSETLSGSTLAAYKVFSEDNLTQDEGDALRGALRDKGYSEQEINSRLSALRDDQESGFQSSRKAWNATATRAERLHQVLMICNMTFGSELQAAYEGLDANIRQLTVRQLLEELRHSSLSLERIDIPRDAASLINAGFKFLRTVILGGVRAKAVAEVTRSALLSQLDPCRIVSGGLSFAEIDRLFRKNTGVEPSGFDERLAIYDGVRTMLEARADGLPSFNKALQEHGLVEYSKLSARYMEYRYRVLSECL